MNDSRRILNRRVFYAGDTIFSEGDYGSQAYVLQSGQVRITRSVTGGRQGTLGIVEPGGIFGEMALIDDSPRMATASTDHGCVCIVISVEDLRKKLVKTDPVLQVLIQMIIRLLRQAADNTPIPADDLEMLAKAAESPNG